MALLQVHRKPLRLTFSVVATSSKSLPCASLPRSFNGTRSRTRTSLRGRCRDVLAIPPRNTLRASKSNGFSKYPAAPNCLQCSLVCAPPSPLTMTTGIVCVRQRCERLRSEEHTSELQSHLNLVC